MTNALIIEHWGIDARPYLQIVYADGSIEYAIVLVAEDNGDGTQLLTLAADLSTGGLEIEQISLLERVRLASDAVTWTFDKAMTCRFGLSVVAVQR